MTISPANALQEHPQKNLQLRERMLTDLRSGPAGIKRRNSVEIEKRSRGGLPTVAARKGKATPDGEKIPEAFRRYTAAAGSEDWRATDTNPDDFQGL